MALFDSPPGGGREATRVGLFVSEEHPRFRRHLPNVIFALSVFEDRPALDIANEMYAARRTSLAPSGATGGGAAGENRRPVSLVVRAQTNEPQRLWIEPSPLPFRWERGDRLELLASPGDSLPELVVRDDGIVVRAAAGCRAFLSVDETAAADAAGFRRVIADETAQFGEFDFVEDLATAASAIAKVLERIEFDWTASDDPAARQAAMRRRAALVAAALVRQIRSTPPAQAALWRIVQRLVGAVGLALEASPLAQDDLWLVAADDSTELPRATLGWLDRHAIAATRRAGESQA